MSCRSYDCESQENFCGCNKGTVKEGFNAGTPPYLGYSGYPGSEAPSQCGGGYGYGGYGHYGTYGGCATYDHQDLDEPGTNQYAELDSYNAVHEPGCWCPQCQAPYSMPYQANKPCNNPYCKCENCDGNCKCGAANAVSGSLVDLGLTNGNGLKGHLAVPGININIDFNALLRYAVMILIVAAISYYLLGLRRR